MMKVKRIIKTLVLSLPILALLACNSKKNNENLEEEKPFLVESKSSNNLLEEVSSKKLQDLKNKNIIYFDFDKHNVSSEYMDILDKHAVFLKENPNMKILIEGHTDNRGTSEYNLSLGEKRANSVRNYLQSKGVRNTQIDIISYGKEKPAISGNDESAFSKNRRVIIIY